MSDRKRGRTGGTRQGGAEARPRQPGRLALLGFLVFACGVLLVPGSGLQAEAGQGVLPYGIAHRIESKPYLNMPPAPSGHLPPLLSQTGAFKDVRNLVPVD